MSSLMTLPVEIRMQIWHLLIPVEFEISSAYLGILRQRRRSEESKTGLSLNTITKYSVRPLPANPRQSLLSISRSILKEVSTTQKPVLCLKVTRLSWYPILSNRNEKLLQTIKRIRILSLSPTRPYGERAGEIEWAECFEQHIWRKRIVCRYRAVQMRHWKHEVVLVSPSTFHLSYELIFDVSDVIPRSSRRGDYIFASLWPLE